MTILQQEVQGFQGSLALFSMRYNKRTMGKAAGLEKRFA